MNVELFINLIASLSSLVIGYKILTDKSFFNKILRQRNMLRGAKTQITKQTEMFGNLVGYSLLLLGIVLLFVVITNINL